MKNPTKNHASFIFPSFCPTVHLLYWNKDPNWSKEPKKEKESWVGSLRQLVSALPAEGKRFSTYLQSPLSRHKIQQLTEKKQQLSRHHHNLSLAR
jgi:hypothetical protein